LKRAFQLTKFRCMLLVMVLFLSMTMISVGFSPSTTKLYVDPPKIERWTPVLGETFKVNVSIANVSDLQSFEFKLYWNTTLLDLTKAEIRPFLNPLWIVTKNEINEALGRYWLNITSIAPPPGKNGSGPLVTLTFNMTYEPVWPENATCILDLADTKLLDSGRNLIPHDVYDGEYWCYSTTPLFLTTTTDKPSYDPGEIISVYGNLSLGFSPVPDGLVALEIDNPLNEIVVIRTMSTGTPPPNQMVEILNVIPCGGPPDYTPKTWFYRGTTAYFNITVKNNDSESWRVLGAVNIHDVNLISLGIGSFEGTILGGSTVWWIFTFPIPDTASIGNAQVYASALTGWPRNDGTPYCPEKPATFEIRGTGGAGATTGLQQNPSISSPEGTYNLTFKLGSDARLGNHTVYATSDYVIDGYYQKVTSNVIFRVGGPWDINGDGKVNIIDIVIVALAFDSRPGDPKWNPKADLNGDGIVNIIDIVIVAVHWTG